MTAEIGILNKTAVALAADSAVTIQREKGQKIYNSANKLFMLSKYHPVGIMLFGNATFMKVPWETIIKEYRKKLSDTEYLTLKDYANDFINYLISNRISFPESEQVKYCKIRLRGCFLSIQQEIGKQLKEIICHKGKTDDEEIKQILSKTIDNHYQKWMTFPLLKDLAEDDVNKFIEKYKSKIEENVKAAFEKLPLDEANIKQLLAIGAGLFLRQRFLSLPNISGIVIAGFGKDDLFPSIISYRLECIVDNKLKYTEHTSESISFDNDAAIIPFAQREMVDTFIEGIDPSLERFSIAYLNKIFVNYPESLLKAILLKDEKDREKILNKLKEASKQIFDDYSDKVKAYKTNIHIVPIVKIVAILPKDELASMAEALVNLTSFKRRVTMDAETVGGPIDVAVISKGDGFVWIKRKHYFKAELNHHFFTNYYRGKENERAEGSQD
ncbi:MAG: hypothetical protein PHE61_06845 [Candidatus Omnitrophica bacterium]|nr:hypothetical protein [Candidatus Omnitrophota bacterium]